MHIYVFMHIYLQHWPYKDELDTDPELKNLLSNEKGKYVCKSSQCNILGAKRCMNSAARLQHERSVH